MWVSGGVFFFKEMEKPYSESQKDLVPHSARCSSEAKNVYFHIHQPNLNNSTINTELHRSVTALLIFRTIYSFRCSCFNCSPVFTSDVEKVRSREGEGWLLVTQWVDKQKAIFSSSPWTRAQWPRQRWTHPGPLICSLLQLCEEKGSLPGHSLSLHFVNGITISEWFISSLSLFCQRLWRCLSLCLCSFSYHIIQQFTVLTCTLDFEKNRLFIWYCVRFYTDISVLIMSICSFHNTPYA